MRNAASEPLYIHDIEQKLERIEKLVGNRTYAWDRQVYFKHFQHPPESVVTTDADHHLVIDLTEYDAKLLRDYFIKMYGYPDEVIVSVGNPNL